MFKELIPHFQFGIYDGDVEKNLIILAQIIEDCLQLGKDQYLFNFILGKNALLDPRAHQRNPQLLEDTLGIEAGNYAFIGSEIHAFRGFEFGSIPIIAFVGDKEDEVFLHLK